MDVYHKDYDSLITFDFLPRAAFSYKVEGGCLYDLPFFWTILISNLI